MTATPNPLTHPLLSTQVNIKNNNLTFNLTVKGVLHNRFPTNEMGERIGDQQIYLLVPYNSSTVPLLNYVDDADNPLYLTVNNLRYNITSRLLSDKVGSGVGLDFIRIMLMRAGDL